MLYKYLIKRKCEKSPLKSLLLKDATFYQKKKKFITVSLKLFFNNHKIFTPRAFARTFFNASFTSVILKV